MVAIFQEDINGDDVDHKSLLVFEEVKRKTNQQVNSNTRLLFQLLMLRLLNEIE